MVSSKSKFFIFALFMALTFSSLEVSLAASSLDLPLQLTDVGDQVNSVLTAMDDEVDPLRSLLPTNPNKVGQSVTTSPESNPTILPSP
ncbi:prolyl oligopeptidase-like protein [Corchorus olitorius]|uniref:Prolyl oligopeptidase-like protein n=1 Tax=Corchorus olitorius TaxID=93759 RepID=A0A1R3JSV6_9ROSI|nr:prolyl oligopeptidase-like protein [Corchorus olitorius]